ncbi:hypothetical protein [Bacteroides caecimuris]|uniref:hypothetical protein n=1 Tax=Bacteroides caecimuris TaxID=1796613 RepID=UPI0023CA092D|nr:hypothetical protein [Bacteroides caecimuris]MDE6879112.1 hypothetical protein [Odoribacter sp.]
MERWKQRIISLRIYQSNSLLQCKMNALYNRCGEDSVSYGFTDLRSYSRTDVLIGSYMPT